MSPNIPKPPKHGCEFIGKIKLFTLLSRTTVVGLPDRALFHRETVCPICMAGSKKLAAVLNVMRGPALARYVAFICPSNRPNYGNQCCYCRRQSQFSQQAGGLFE